MFRVHILEGGSRKTQPYLLNCLKKACREGQIDAAFCDGKADLLIAPRGAALLREPEARVLLTVGATQHPGAVCCGLGEGDDLTLSSIRDDRAMLALRQELTTLDGSVLEPQEIPLTLSAAAAPEPEALATAAAAMLLLGADAAQGLRM